MSKIFKLKYATQSNADMNIGAGDNNNTLNNSQNNTPIHSPSFTSSPNTNKSEEDNAATTPKYDNDTTNTHSGAPSHTHKQDTKDSNNNNEALTPHKKRKSNVPAHTLTPLPGGSIYDSVKKPRRSTTSLPRDFYSETYYTPTPTRRRAATSTAILPHTTNAYPDTPTDAHTSLPSRRPFSYKEESSDEDYFDDYSDDDEVSNVRKVARHLNMSAHATTTTSSSNNNSNNNTSTSDSSVNGSGKRMKKIPACSRCGEKAAWKHDKKGKRWFCKHCKLPFTPGVSGSTPKPKRESTRNIETEIPPCTRCGCVTGWKHDKERYFCKKCRRTFLPVESDSDGIVRDEDLDDYEDEEGDSADFDDDAQGLTNFAHRADVKPTRDNNADEPLDFLDNASEILMALKREA